MLQRLKALVPAGVTVTRGESPSPGVESFVRYFELDDGRGACWLAMSAQQLAGSELSQQRHYMQTLTTPNPDGTLDYIQQIPHPSGVAPYQVAEALRADGMSISMTLSTASYPDRAPVRSGPILSPVQLAAIATSPEWEPGQ
jgi:hypothetical protein